MSGRRAEGEHVHPYTEMERINAGQKTYVFHLDDDTVCTIIRPSYREARRAFLRALKRRDRDSKRIKKELKATKKRIREFAEQRKNKTKGERYIQCTLFDE